MERINQACLPSPTAEDRLSMGILCLVLGLSNEALREFDDAAKLESAMRAEADQFRRLQFGR